ncbi:hypothetical protein CBS101457_001572 [Exobasidium rhododendri]|nr:hypothetical protein CBS101457_001572 [Exobasidium rhododendri]
MTAPADTNAHTTISKLRSRFGSLGKNGLGRGSQSSPVTPGTTKGHEATVAEPLQGIDYSPKARSFVVKNSLRQLYPAIDAFKTGMLKVDDRHEIYYEVCGNEKGAPVVFLHGGPGGGCSRGDRCWFDPSHYCIYLFDQRASGRSTPHADLQDNTTWDIVGDVEKLREHFGIDKWHLFGGSWGSCLALVYAQAHPDRVKSMVLRGIFTLRRSELLFFYQDGASHLFPDLFEIYRDFIPEEERDDLMSAYHKRLTGDDENVKLEAAKHWSRWENGTAKFYIDEEMLAKADDDKWALAFARIESHYFANRGWMTDGQILEKANVDKIRHIPTILNQGRFDVVCPAKTAHDLFREWPEVEFNLIPDSGHNSKDPGMLHKLIESTDKMRSIK